MQRPAAVDLPNLGDSHDPDLSTDPKCGVVKCQDPADTSYERGRSVYSTTWKRRARCRKQMWVVLPKSCCTPYYRTCHCHVGEGIVNSIMSQGKIDYRLNGQSLHSLLQAFCSGLSLCPILRPVVHTIVVHELSRVHLNLRISLIRAWSCRLSRVSLYC